MVTMIAHHAVADYETWINGGKAAMNNTERSAQAGIVSSKVYRSANGGGVVVMHTFNNLESAQKYEKMMQSTEGHAMVEKMGGKLPITIWLVEEVKL